MITEIKKEGDPIPILFDNLEIKNDEQANEEGICCPMIDNPEDFKCIIEGKVLCSVVFFNLYSFLISENTKTLDVFINLGSIYL